MNGIFKFSLLSVLFLCLGLQFSIAQQPKTKVTLGIKLDYFFSGDDGGVKAKGTVSGKVAEKVGIKGGDIILAFDKTPIRGLFHYRDLLQEYTAGDVVKVKVKRKNEILYFTVKFE